MKLIPDMTPESAQRNELQEGGNPMKSNSLLILAILVTVTSTVNFFFRTFAGSILTVLFSLLILIFAVFKIRQKSV